ncbi:MAG: hypothetical protein LBG75_00160 [Candidatus Nomurabacteria bacterium]|jgi:hypothetical protein|nr:hypothetical protein [Candidatus Nomurabacteria bacterium]
MSSNPLFPDSKNKSPFVGYEGAVLMDDIGHMEAEHKVRKQQQTVYYAVSSPTNTEPLTAHDWWVALKWMFILLGLGICGMFDAMPFYFTIVAIIVIESIVRSVIKKRNARQLTAKAIKKPKEQPKKPKTKATSKPAAVAKPTIIKEQVYTEAKPSSYIAIATIAVFGVCLLILPEGTGYVLGAAIALSPIGLIVWLVVRAAQKSHTKSTKKP